ncbi:MAG: hypothetical protein ACRCWY_01190 [Cellulosilyticaceae bacterium]
MQCPICRTPLHGEKFCPECGQAITYEGMPAPPIQRSYVPTYTPIPDAVKKFNWAAFTLSFNMAWGIGNRCYLPFLCLIPYFNLVWCFVCGFKGNEWAWKNGNYKPEDLEKFLTIQNTWNRGGIAQFIFAAIGFVLAIIINIFFLALTPALFY